MTARHAAPIALAASFAVAVLAGTNGPNVQRAERPGQAAPRLIVIIVVDQFRADYERMYGHQWTRGLKRLFSQGAVFERAAFPYGDTVTCPGHATVSTGTVPAVHGIVGNTWYDRTLRRTIGCTVTASATPVGFSGIARERHSPDALQVPTFADELRRQAARPPTVVSIALKARSAIMLAGKGAPGTFAVWQEDNGAWATSSAYTTTPWPAVSRFIAARPIDAAYGHVWTRLLPAPAYRFDDEAPGEHAPVSWDTTFPHRVESPMRARDAVFVSAWRRSPLSDAYVANLAIELLASMRLGRANRTDLLALSLASLDLIGHEYGPRSHEVQDTLARLDLKLGQLLDALDKQVGHNRYVVALTGDHGVALLPEQASQTGAAAGRLAWAQVRQAVQKAIAAHFGDGTYVGALADQNLSLTPGTYDRLRATPGAVEAVKQAIRSVAGIEHVYSADELASRAPTNDAVLRTWRLSYFSGRSGDFVVTPRPFWLARATGTTHGTHHDYDRHVPLVLFGAGIDAARQQDEASPADIAPTLASLLKIRLPQATGRILIEAAR